MVPSGKKPLRVVDEYETTPKPTWDRQRWLLEASGWARFILNCLLALTKHD